jgi:hypothetical protein
MESAFLQALHDNPADEASWMALAERHPREVSAWYNAVKRQAPTAGAPWATKDSDRFPFDTPLPAQENPRGWGRGSPPPH